ncbi:MAG: FAD-binding oxidoreductase [Candidatus Freyrarchaeum guaymaensis]
MDQKEIYEALAAIVGEDDVTIDPVELLAYASDASFLRAIPVAVARPENKEEVAEILKFADENRIPVTPRGAGTSYAGQSLAYNNAILIDMVKMDKILEINTQDRVAVVQPGVIYGELNKELRKHGYCFPPDPGSAVACTVGGMVGNNASGVRALKYGATVDHVLGLEVVLPGGKIIRTGGRVWKSSSGYNLTKLFVGSEGTLGVFTEIILKITPAPKYTAMIMPVFEKYEQGLEAATEIINSGILPSAMEILDDICIMVLNSALEEKLPQAGAILFIELDGSHEEVIKEEAETVRNVCEKIGVKQIIHTTDPKRAEELWRLRHSLGNLLAKVRGENMAINSIMDFAVPISKVPEAVKEVKEIAARYQRLMAAFGHIGDGNVHMGSAINVEDPKQREMAVKFSKEAAEVIIKKYGGTLSAEHGIGMAKSAFITMEHGDTLELMRGIKRVFDPNNIMNPMVMGLTEIPRDEYVYMAGVK